MPEITIPATDPSENLQNVTVPPEGEALPTSPEAPASGTPPDDSGTLPAAPEFQSIRDAAGGYEYDLSSYENDEDAFRHLIDRSRDYDRQQETIKHYESLLAQQQVAPPEPAITPQPSAEQQPQWDWQPPAYNPMWLSQAQRNPDTGQLEPVNGGTPTQLAQLQNFLDYRANQMDKFWTEGPFQYMSPYIDNQFETRQEALETKMQEMIDAALGNHNAQTEASLFRFNHKFLEYFTIGR